MATRYSRFGRLLALGAMMVCWAGSEGCVGSSSPTSPQPTTPPQPVTAALKALTLTPTSVTGDGTATGSIELTAAAPTGGATVTLSSTDPAVSVPGSAVVGAGSTSQTFAIRTYTPSSTRTVTVTAKYLDISVAAVLEVQMPLNRILSMAGFTGTLGSLPRLYIGSVSTPGASVSVTLTARNTGSQTLSVSNFTMGGALGDWRDFSVFPSSFTLSPGASRSLTVTFRPYMNSGVSTHETIATVVSDATGGDTRFYVAGSCINACLLSTKVGVPFW